VNEPIKLNVAKTLEYIMELQPSITEEQKDVIEDILERFNGKRTLEAQVAQILTGQIILKVDMTRKEPSA